MLHVLMRALDVCVVVVIIIIIDVHSYTPIESLHFFRFFNDYFTCFVFADSNYMAPPYNKTVTKMLYNWHQNSIISHAQTIMLQTCINMIDGTPIWRSTLSLFTTRQMAIAVSHSIVVVEVGLFQIYFAWN